MIHPPWGLLPETVVDSLHRREWLNPAHLRGRLNGSRPFPIRVTLKPPTANQALTDLDHFRRFVQSWQAWPHPEQVQWRTKTWQRLGQQTIPVAVQIESMAALIAILGSKAENRSRNWEKLMQPLLELDSCLAPVLIRHLSYIESLNRDDTRLLAELLPQLSPGMGEGNYLRALPLKQVDTKFVETHQTLIGDCLDVLHQGAITASGGLVSWLRCRSTPGGWLQIRPLCPDSRRQLAGLPLLQMDAHTLSRYPLPAPRILIIENKQTGYALPSLENTIAVFGGGRNTSWMQAEWLRHKKLGYWGDIDSWGLAILSDARRHQPCLQALMMDESTLIRHLPRMVEEPNPHETVPPNLTEVEHRLFCRLREGRYKKNRLEQERLAPDYILECLTRWHGLHN